MSEKQTAMAGQYLTFFVGGEEYAIEVLRITEIMEFSGATRVPGTPRSVLGVINLRGKVVPVIDLSVKFGSSRTGMTNRTCVVIVEIDLEGETSVMGLLTDAVRHVIDIPESAIEPPPPFGTRARVDYLRGIGRCDENFVLVLDIDRLMTVEEENAVAGVDSAELAAGASV